MAKRQSRTGESAPIVDSASLSALERQVIAIAEQLGRLAGSAQAKADGWLDHPAFQSQLTRIRDRASRLMGRLNGKRSPKNGGASSTAARVRSREKVAAPGKKHRKAPESARGVKHSDQRITKTVAARRRKAARPRQG